MFAKFFTVALLVTSTFAADCARKYTVKEGDICDSISKAQNVSTYQLRAVNSQTIDPQCSNLAPGKEICLGYPGEDCTTTYVVKPDDTCAGIQTANGLNSTILSLNNPQIDDSCDNIYIGQVLCVSQSVQVPPVPSGGLVVPVGSPATPAPSPPAGQSATNPPAPPAPATTVPTTIAPKPTPTPTPAAASGDQGGDSGADDNDDDLPYCDEV